MLFDGGLPVLCRGGDPRIRPPGWVEGTLEKITYTKRGSKYFLVTGEDDTTRHGYHMGGMGVSLADHNWWIVASGPYPDADPNPDIPTNFDNDIPTNFDTNDWNFYYG